MLLSRLNAGFWLLWLSLLLVCYFNSADDPTSLFYNASRAYEQKYSLQRAASAASYLEHISTAPHPPAKSNSAAKSKSKEQSKSKAKSSAPEFLCIGIPSVNRSSESFLGHTLATLTDTLAPHQRATVRIVVLLADRAPAHNAAYAQPWLSRIADEVLLYGQPPTTGADVYRTIPYNVQGARGSGRVENMRLDHSVLVEACRTSGAPYFALIEDDVVASTTWFAKLSAGLAHVKAESRKSGRDWLYLRLFYSELFMGWNKEEWPSYVQNILFAYTIVLLGFLAKTLLFRRKHSHPPNKHATSGVLLMALILCLWLPALIVLYLVAGRISMRRINPFAWTWHPAREMPNYGCCAQGMVFPLRHLDGVQKLFRDPPYAFAGDQILEDYARDHALAKWALEPSVLQHVGLRQSSAGDERSEVWNFSFERQHSKR